MSRDRFDVLERYAPLFEAPDPSFQEFLHRRERKQRNRRMGTAVVALAVAAAGIGGLARTFSSETIPASDPRSPFVGTWVTTDGDGSTQTMTIRAPEEGAVEIVVHDDAASVCSGAPSTMTGMGRLEGSSELLIPSPVLTCDDGIEPQALSGPPLEEQLRNLNFVHDPESDTLTDNLELVWERVDFPNLTTTFVSPRNGFSIKHPDRVALTPAKQLWGFSKQVDDGFDVVDTGLGAVFKGASTGPGTWGDLGSIDERVDEYLSNDYDGPRLPGGCGVPRSQQAEVTIDGHSGRISECENRIEATVVASGRLYLFTLLHDRSDARAVFDAFVATIDLTPETAVDFPGLTTTFVSPTYGYSFKYHDRGGNAVAASGDDRFDNVETGFGAYFSAASTQIPDGVSIDERVDEYLSDPSVSPRGCGVPRSQQAEITIDGQPGRIAECPNQIEATVVAGGRLYLFILEHDRSDARAFFDAWVDTIDLTPETAAVP